MSELHDRLKERKDDTVRLVPVDNNWTGELAKKIAEFLCTTGVPDMLSLVSAIHVLSITQKAIDAAYEFLRADNEAKDRRIAELEAALYGWHKFFGDSLPIEVSRRLKESEEDGIRLGECPASEDECNPYPCPHCNRKFCTFKQLESHSRRRAARQKEKANAENSK